ncbi:hypothetical protein Pflav_076410 [Phytohabitans flavus]|uniref:Core-binding (CB) domain-containing protein n=1 Tax=Phytohabitans flavus TaxID=1076124 RepID=A0A6F8Y5J6_9ACTN|nr:hypothetical protein Pflav_076410 [Phytohabitans flavus]
MSEGSISKRCGCRDPGSGKLLGNTCPKLRRPNGTWSPDHGLWQYQLELPVTATGGRRQLRRGSFDSYRAAADELDHARQLLALAGRDRDRRLEVADLMQAAAKARQPLPDLDSIRIRLRANAALTEAPTVATYLTEWLTGLTIDDNTLRGYASHVRVHLIPHLGDIRLDKLKARHIKAMFTAIEARNNEIRAAKTSDDPQIRNSVRGVRPTGPATRHGIRATLRKAINDALAEELIAGITNPATLVKTPAERTRPIVWEPERVARWQQTGQVPGPVMVWTDELLVQFLDYAAEHDPDLHPMYHVMAYRGPRRGEACGLLDAEVRLAKKEVTINNQIATHGRTTKQKPRKATPGTGTSSSTTTPSKSSPPTRPAAPPGNSPPAPTGPTPDCSSSAPTAGHGIPTWSPNASADCSAKLGYHPSGRTTCATAPPPWPSTPASTSRSSPNNSAIAPPRSPSTPTPASSNASTTKPPTPSPTKSNNGVTRPPETRCVRSMAPRERATNTTGPSRTHLDGPISCSPSPLETPSRRPPDAGPVGGMRLRP